MSIFYLARSKGFSGLISYPSKSLKAIIFKKPIDL
jgi:hypothetical protein